MGLLWKIRMTFSSHPGEGLGAVKSTSWKDILKTRCWSTDVTDGKPLGTVNITRALKELLRKGITSQRLNKVMKGLKVWHWGLCTVYIYPQSEIVKNSYLSGTNKEVEVNNKRHTRIRIWAFACKWHQPLMPTLFLSLIFPYSFVAPLPQVSLLLDWSWQSTLLKIHILFF